MKSMRKKLKPSWTFVTEKKIWRLLPGNGVLAVELRDTEAKTAEYAGIEISSGSPLWEGVSFEESWWIVMNRVFKDVLLLQQFVKPNMPTPAGIYAIDLFTGKVLWQNRELSLINASNDLVYVSRKSIQSEDIAGLNYKSGAEVIVFSAEDPQVDKISSVPQQDEFRLSSFFEEIKHVLSKNHAEVLTKAMPAGAANPTFILAVSGKDIIGFYTSAGKDEKGVPVYDSHIRIVDSVGKIVFDDVVDTKVYTTLGDFYFVVGTMLIYARNSMEIVAVDLKT